MSEEPKEPRPYRQVVLVLSEEAAEHVRTCVGVVKGEGAEIRKAVCDEIDTQLSTPVERSRLTETVTETVPQKIAARMGKAARDAFEGRLDDDAA